MTRTLIYDEVFCQFYDEAEIENKPAGAWPIATPQDGDVVRTVEREHPSHRAAIVKALLALGMRIGRAWDGVNASVRAVRLCGTCGGDGSVDSGGVTSWGVCIEVTCPECGGDGEAK